jgi:RNA polymerase-binding transcription factor DksA
VKESIEELKVRRAVLVKRLESIQRDIGGGLEKDLEEQAVQLENLEVLQEISRVARQEIKDIDRKLDAMNAAESD